MMTQKVIEIVCDVAEIPPERVAPDKDLVEECFIDSLDMLQIFVDVEEAFDMKFPEEEFDKLRTVNDIVAYLKRG